MVTIGLKNVASINLALFQSTCINHFDHLKKCDLSWRGDVGGRGREEGSAWRIDLPNASASDFFM